MARKIRSKDLETRSARLRLRIDKKPHPLKLMRGVHQRYRRNKTAGTWDWRDTHNGVDLIERIGLADDYEEANGKDILNFWQAQDVIRERARVGKPTNDPSIKAHVQHYRTDLETRGQDPANATRVLFYLEGTKLANKVMTAPSLADDLKDFRDRLVAKGLKPASIDRTTAVFKAALNLAADNDERITCRPWKTALKAIGSEEAEARNAILDDADRRTLRGAAYRDSDEFGLLIDVLDETGARPSQVVRLIEDVQADFIDRRTGERMPVSRKGRGKRQLTHRPVPITPELADRLKGRSGVLLKRADGRLWAEINLANYFEGAMEGVKFNNVSKVTMYSLRHMSIVRMLIRGAPISKGCTAQPEVERRNFRLPVRPQLAMGADCRRPGN